jgi:hypothetical protein
VKLCVEKWLEMWPNDSILHHDKTPAHKALSVQQFVAQKSIMEMKHSPYSPHLIPNDLRYFTKIKSALRVQRFQDTEDIRRNVMMVLKAIPQQEFQNCFQQWQHRWAKCITAQGD